MKKKDYWRGSLELEFLFFLVVEGKIINLHVWGGVGY